MSVGCSWSYGVWYVVYVWTYDSTLVDADVNMSVRVYRVCCNSGPFFFQNGDHLSEWSVAVYGQHRPPFVGTRIFFVNK